MATGISINVGVNRVDRAGYGGWEGDLRGCENDAAALAEFAEARGFEKQVLLTEEATTDNLDAALGSAADRLEGGDFLFVSFSGYGGRMPGYDRPRSDDTWALRAEDSWALFDRQLVVEIELFGALRRFNPKTRIFVVADTCFQRITPRAIEGDWNAGSSWEPREKWISTDVSRKAYDVRRVEYDAIIRQRPRRAGWSSAEVAFAMLHSCLPYQAAFDGDPYGLFTDAFRKVADHGFRDYLELRDRLFSALPPTQNPELVTAGKGGDALLAERPLELRETM